MNVIDDQPQFKYTPSPYENVINTIREIMFDLDDIEFAVNRVTQIYSPPI